MPSYTPPPTWVDGYVNAALMNARVRDAIKELQIGAPRGIISTATSSANTAASSSTAQNITGLGGNITVDSPRTLQAVFQGTLRTDTANTAMQVRVYIGGQQSIVVQKLFTLAGGNGQEVANITGIAIPVPAGTVALQATVALAVGSGTVTVLSGATLQIVDAGAA